MATENKPKTIVGKVSYIDFPLLGLSGIPARIDTGAKVSSLWATDIKETKKGLVFKLFGANSELYSGKSVTVEKYGQREVSSSMGHIQLRYEVRLKVTIEGRRITATFTLADRSLQSYPILIGRSILHNKFVVDVSKGKRHETETARQTELDKLIGESA